MKKFAISFIFSFSFFSFPLFATTSESEGPIEVIIERPTEEGLPQELVTEKQLTEAELNYQIKRRAKKSCVILVSVGGGGLCVSLSGVIVFTVYLIMQRFGELENINNVTTQSLENG